MSIKPRRWDAAGEEAERTGLGLQDSAAPQILCHRSQGLESGPGGHDSSWAFVEAVGLL